MGYTIGQAAKKIGLTTHTLRYYDKEGLLPFVGKSSSGLRIFSETDLEWLVIIECLKGTGLSIKDIRQYIDWYCAGNSTLQKRLDMFRQQKQKLEEQMAQIQKHMEKINLKIAFYEDAVANGNMNVYERNKCLAEEKNRIFGKELDRMGEAAE